MIINTRYCENFFEWKELFLAKNPKFKQTHKFEETLLSKIKGKKP